MRRLFRIWSEMGIRKRVFALLILIYLPFLLLEAYVYYRWFQERKQLEMQANLELARAVSKNFETYLQGVIRDELAVGVAMTASQPPSERDRNRLLDRLKEASPSVRSIFWMNAEGIVTASSQRSYIGLALSDRSFFQSAMKKQAWSVSGLFPGWSEGEPSFTVSCAIHDETDNLLGVAAAAIDPNRLDSVLGIGRMADSTLNLVDHRGMQVFCYPTLDIGWDQRNWIDRYPVLQVALAGGEVMTDIESALTGKKHLAAFTPVLSIGWVAACSRAEKDVAAAIMQTLMPHMALTLLVTLGGFGAAIGLSRLITRSILRLKDHAEACGRGEATPIALDGPNELKALADTMNEMTQAIHLRETALQESESRYRRAMEKSQVLNRIGGALHATLDVEEILKTIVTEGAHSLGSESAAAALWQKDRWLVRHVHGISLGSMANILKDLDPWVEKCLASRQPMAMEDTFGAPHLEKQPMQRHHTRSVMMAPLIIRADIIGLLVFGYHLREHTFTDEELDFVRQMASIAGIALSNARLFQELEDSNQELNEFGYALAHNIRAPLRAMRNYGQFLVQDAADVLEGAPREYLSGLEAALQQAHDQIEDLETLYRIKQHEVRTEAFTLLDFFEEMHAIFPDSSDQHLMTTSTSPIICGERFLLRQILIELIRNGFKFNQSKPKRIEIACRPTVDQSGIEIAVRDNGIGIDPQHRDRIFRIFQRLHTTKEYEGTGIGLAIVKRAVQKMGGTLELESAPGRGSLFRIRLPRAAKAGHGVC